MDPSYKMLPTVSTLEYCSTGKDSWTTPHSSPPGQKYEVGDGKKMFKIEE